MATVAKKPRVQVNINNEWCKGCGICMSFCPKHILALNDDGKVYVTDSAKCGGCGNCEIYCPDFAISLGRLDDESKQNDQVNAR